MQENSVPKLAIVGLVIAVLAVAGVVVYAVQNDTSKPATKPTTTTTTASSPSATDTVPAPSERVTIAFTDQGFEPSKVTVKKGTTVVIQNKSSRSVQFSSDDHPAHTENTEMNLGVVKTGEFGSYVADKAGTWGYHDHLDEVKTGTVTVTEQ